MIQLINEKKSIIIHGNDFRSKNALPTFDMQSVTMFIRCFKVKHLGKVQMANLNHDKIACGNLLKG